MDKRGNIYFGIVVCLIVWCAGILILPYIVDDVTTFRTALDCTNSSISDFSKVNCLAGDSLVPYYLWTIFSIAIGFVAGSKS